MSKPYVAQGGKPIFNEFISPIGLFVHMFHDKPQLKTKDQYGNIPDLDEKGIQRAEFKVTMAWDKSEAQGALTELINLANQTKHEAWPESANPQAFFALQPFFRDGDNPEHNTKQREYLLGKYYLNFKQKAEAAKDPTTGQVIYSGAPGLLGPRQEAIMPTDIYSGCTGRVSGIMFGTEYMGKHFISTRLNNIQLFESPDTNPKLERLFGGGRPEAKEQFGALKEGGGTGNGGMGGLGGLGL